MILASLQNFGPGDLHNVFDSFPMVVLPADIAPPCAMVMAYLNVRDMIILENRNGFR